MLDDAFITDNDALMFEVVTFDGGSTQDEREKMRNIAGMSLVVAYPVKAES